MGSQIRNPTILYDVGRNESENIADERPDIVEELSGKLKEFLGRMYRQQVNLL